MKINVPYTIDSPTLGALQWVNPRETHPTLLVKVQEFILTIDYSRDNEIRTIPIGEEATLYLAAEYSAQSNLAERVLQNLKEIKAMVRLAIGDKISSGELLEIDIIDAVTKRRITTAKLLYEE